MWSTAPEVGHFSSTSSGQAPSLQQISLLIESSLLVPVWRRLKCSRRASSQYKGRSLLQHTCEYPTESFSLPRLPTVISMIWTASATREELAASATFSCWGQSFQHTDSGSCSYGISQKSGL
mmetsp:Transcript_46751/g.68331  ORF Transcript_46751/g.68331 Transcript_46751/m.68331 type:complete len:122 (-) Transcript_46751:583-948(-)